MTNRRRVDPSTIPEISRRLRLLRATTGLSQAEFARQVGVSRNAWNNFELEVGRINVDAAMKLCRKYLVTLDWIYLNDSRLVPDMMMERLRAAERAEKSGKSEKDPRSA